MLSAYAPHLGEELWEKIGHSESVLKISWPKYDKELTLDEENTIVIQVNGKIRDKFSAAAGTAKEELEKTAMTMPGLQKWIEGQTIVKVIVVPGKLVNIVIK
jgi:leucyl-tRNA synthetase